MGNCDNDDDKVFKSCKRSKFYDLAKDIDKSIKQNMETEDTSTKVIKCLQDNTSREVGKSNK